MSELAKSFGGVEEFTGNAGAGMVTVTIDSKLIVKDVKIDNEVFKKTMPEAVEDFDFMADLFQAATNQALEKAYEAAKSKLSGLSSLSGLNGLGKPGY